MGGRNCEGVARIIDMQYRHTWIFQDRIFASDDRNCATLDCVGGIGGAISLYTLEGRKKEAVFDFTRV
ncbi:hypothetical protein D3C79_1024020 [compost metagenome]